MMGRIDELEIRELLDVLAAQKREVSEVHTAYDRILYRCVVLLADEVEILKRENRGLWRVLNARTEHLA